MTEINGIPKAQHLPFTIITATTGTIPTYIGLVDCRVTANANYALPPIQDAVGQMLPGALLSIRNLTAFTLTLTADSPDLIDGAATYVVPATTTVELVTSPIAWGVWTICNMS